MRQANEAIIRERLPIPTVDEVLSEVNGSTVFSKLDFKQGFHQVELDRESRDITTFGTHDGLFRYKRLSFGVTSAPEKFQHIVRQALSGCQGAVNIADDVVVHGKDQEEHDRRLYAVLHRLLECGLTLNPAKCAFRLPKVTFMGFLVSQHGIGPTEEKVRAVGEAERPTTASEIRSFLGMVGFSARFIPDFSTTAEPLRAVSRKDSVFRWGEQQQAAFDKLKAELVKTTELAFFQVGARTKVIADASPVGLGAVLVQQQDGDDRAVLYASRSLSNVERRYSQTEKEALALVWACERFHLYLYGLQEFELVTDHRALEVIYSPRSKPSARIERWVLRLQPYRFRVTYVPSARNIADALSRLGRQAQPVTAGQDNFIAAIATKAVPRAMRIADVEQASKADAELRDIRRRLQQDDWSGAPKGYAAVRNELTYVGYVILRGTRLVIPSALRQQVLDLAHEGHQGVVKTKQQLRTMVWWPGIDMEVEKVCRTCHGCQLVGSASLPPPVKATPFPDGPWQELATDLLGPMPSGESLLVLVDYYSRYYEVEILRSTTSAVVIRRLKAQFARHGIPVGLRTDNGPQFASDEFTSFLREMGIAHRRTTPLWPRANGEVERQNRSLLKAIRIAHAEGKDWRQELQVFLLAYRTTPHSTTGEPPATLLFRRTLHTKLPSLDHGSFDSGAEQAVRDRVSERQQLSTDDINQRRASEESRVNVGDKVLVRQEPVTKLSTPFKPEPFSVVDRKGDQVIVTNDSGSEMRRNVQQVKRFESASAPTVDLPSEPELQEVQPDLRRSTRERRPNVQLADYVLK